MATVTERLERALEREAPVWGIRPVPPEHRRLNERAFAVLWGDLSIGLLVIVTGALLVPAMGLPRALLAIVVGSVIGCLPLALVGVAGAREGVPGMVLFRPVLGRLGSFIPSALNLAQLIGWVAVELWAMGQVANEVSKDLFGLDSFALWLGVVAVVATVLALGGPILVVRRWLERFGVYVVAAVAAWLTYRVLAAGDVGAAWDQPGTGGLPFWLAVDLVVVMPLSWLPLVADYNRFAKPGTSTFAGTYLGYLAGNVWFYSLGALLVLTAGVAPDVAAIGHQVAGLAGGAFVLLVLLVGESDQAFANIYSSAVTVQNVFPRASQRGLIVGVAAIGVALAAMFTMVAYEFFLFLIGSVFVPLAGVFLAHYFVLNRGRYGEAVLFGPTAEGVRWRAMIPWVLGFVLYHWCVPTGPEWWTGAVRWFFSSLLQLPFPLFRSELGASIPSFVLAFALALAILPWGRRPEEPEPASA